MQWVDIKALAGGFVHRSDIDFEGLAPLAAADISLALIVQENEASASVVSSGPTSEGLYSAALPADFARIRAVAQGAGTLDPVDMKRLRGVRDHSVYTISGQKLWTQGGGSLWIVYSARELVPAAVTPIMDVYPQVWLNALLKYAASYIQDPEVNAEFYADAFQNAVAAANAQYLDQAFGQGMSSAPGVGRF